MKKIFPLIVIILCITSCGRHHSDVETEQNDSIPPLGFWEEDYIKEEGEVNPGETFSTLMIRSGLSAAEAYDLTLVCDSVFNARLVRAGCKFDRYYSRDSLHTLEYAVYHHDRIHCTIFKCLDSLAVWTYEKPVTITQRYADITINESLWNDMVSAGAPYDLILDLDDIFAWTVDFFSLQKGDRFKALYDERSIDGEVLDIAKVDYAEYQRDNKVLHAIRFDQGDNGNKYWSETGESLRKAFLKAPLKFTRISSKFSYHRKHPISGKVKAHTGVDYAAPSGTPVYALGDGTVLSAGWGGAGGNTVKIRHNSVYTTAYLHLKGFAKGIKAGVRVSQGQLIGYVGSTGSSTGPHLDFRVWKNGTPIDPLKMESPSAEPLKEENKAALDSVFRIYKSALDSLAR
ncbi:MAG: peptidoglycan DD-metalloendopeptidase family protein [Bacteroidales bacterium]|nr:peptidoglycan DD-metalloendopeptidase family protein [Bacteroidales bacterium]